MFNGTGFRTVGTQKYKIASYPDAKYAEGCYIIVSKRLRIRETCKKRSVRKGGTAFRTECPEDVPTVYFFRDTVYRILPSASIIDKVSVFAEAPRTEKPPLPLTNTVPSTDPTFVRDCEAELFTM